MSGRAETSAVAVVGISVPPDPSGQAKVLQRLFDHVGREVIFCSSSPAPEEDSPYERVTLSPAEIILSSHSYPHLPVKDDLATEFGLAGGRTLSIVRRVSELMQVLGGRNIAAVVGCSGDPIDLTCASIVAQRLNKPFIAYLFDDPIYQWENLSVLRRMAVFLEPLWFSAAHLVLTPNETLAADVRERNARLDFHTRVEVLRNPAFCERPPEARTKAPPTGPMRIVYTGSVYHAQGDAIRNVIAAMRRRPGLYELHLYSPQGEDHFNAEGITGPEVFRYDHVPAEQAAAIQQEADLLLLPLAFRRIPEVIRSSSPLKTGDYLTSGTPILVHAPAATWLSQFFKERACGVVVDTDDVDAVAAALESLRLNVGLRTRLRSAQADTAAEFYTSAIAERFAALLGEAQAAYVPRLDAFPMLKRLEERIARSPGKRRPFNSAHPRILFVAMETSPHTARWIEMIADLGWDLHIFPIFGTHANANLCGVTMHTPTLSRAKLEDRRELALPAFAQPGTPPVRLEPFRVRLGDIGGVEGLRALRVSLGEAGETAPIMHGPGVLASLVRQLQPDFIHSMEFQHAGYLVSAAKAMYGPGFPPWLATNWGSDIYHFGQFPEHRIQLERMLGQIDYYSCECHRDIKEAWDFGYRGPVLRVLTNTGGFDLEHVDKFRVPGQSSARRRIMVKGYQHFAGRAMTALHVLESIADRLQDYEIILYSVSAEPLEKAKELNSRGVLNIKIVGWADHDEMLGYFGSARLYLGVSISDAVSTSVLEAMAMGAFPIQTNTSCCDEWFIDGEGGLIIPPDDVDYIRNAVLRALEDDALVDRAAEINRRTVAQRLDRRILAPQVADFYRPILDDIRIATNEQRAA